MSEASFLLLLFRLISGNSLCYIILNVVVIERIVAVVEALRAE